MEMAHIRKRNGKWIAEIRKKDFKKIQKTFLQKSNATNWAKEIEYLMDKNQYQDYGDSSRFTLGDLIRKYRDEITINKKGVTEETYKLNLILRYKIVKCRLLELKTNHIYDFKKEIKDIPGMKPFFKLNPPKKGFERKGIKVPFAQGGVLGYRKDKINNLLMRMI